MVTCLFFSHNFVCDASHLMAGVKRLQRRSFSANDDIINTSPSKWPGNLNACIFFESTDLIVILFPHKAIHQTVYIVFCSCEEKFCFEIYKMFMTVSQPRWLSWMRIRLVIRRFRVLPPLGQQHSIMEIDHEIFSMVILSLP